MTPRYYSGPAGEIDSYPWIVTHRDVRIAIRSEAMASFDVNEFNRKMREAQRRAEQEFKREVDRVNRANQKAVDDYNRKANAHNTKIVADYNARARDHNRRA